MLSVENQSLDEEWGEWRMTVLFQYVEDHGVEEGMDLDCLFWWAEIS